MSEALVNENYALTDLLKQAQDQTENRVHYVNHAVFSVSSNEVTIDFFLVTRDPLYGMEAAARVNRIIIPLSLAKEMSTQLLDATSQWEATFGIKLPFDDAGQNSETVTHRSDHPGEPDPASDENAGQGFDALMAYLASSDEGINDLDDEELEELRFSR